MPGDVANLMDVRRETNARRSETNRQALRTLLGLLDSCRATVELLHVEDAASKSELLETIGLSEMNALRLLADEEPEGFV